MTFLFNELYELKPSEESKTTMDDCGYNSKTFFLNFELPFKKKVKTVSINFKQDQFAGFNPITLVKHLRFDYESVFMN